jgi:hypothetical protein
MRTAGVLVLALAIGVSSAGAADQGRNQPPVKLSDSNKALWMGEWVACNNRPLSALAREIGMKIPSGRTPQTEAKLVAQKAESPLYDIYDGLSIAIDGCRSGILWRYYHAR